MQWQFPKLHKSIAVASAVALVAIQNAAVLAQSMQFQPGSYKPKNINSAPNSMPRLVELPEWKNCLYFSIAVSPDNRTVATGGDSGVQLWDANSKKLLRTLKGAHREVLAVAFSPDGRSLAAASMDGKLQVWSVDSGELSLALKGHKGGPIEWLRFSVDGENLAAACTGSIPTGKSFESKYFAAMEIWNLKSLQVVQRVEVPTNQIEPYAVSDNLSYLAKGRNGPLQIWDTAEAKIVGTFRHTAPKDSEITAITFDASAARVAYATTRGTVTIIDRVTGKRVCQLASPPKGVTVLKFSPDGKLLAGAGGDKLVRLWNCTSGRLVSVTDTQSSEQSPLLCFTPDSKFLLSRRSLKETRPSRTDKLQNATIWYDSTNIWDVLAQRSAGALIGRLSSIETVRFASDGSHMVTGSDDGSQKLWNLFRDERPFELAYRAQSAALLANGRLFASIAGDTIKVHDLERGSETTAAASDTYSRPLELSKDGNFFVSLTKLNTINLWDCRRGGSSEETVPYRLTRSWQAPTSEAKETHFALSANGTFVAAGGGKADTKIWDTQTGECSASLAASSEPVSALAFSSDNSFLATASGGTVTLWNTHDWSRICAIKFFGLGKPVQTLSDLTEAYDNNEGALEENSISSIVLAPNNRTIAAVHGDRIGIKSLERDGNDDTAYGSANAFAPVPEDAIKIIAGTSVSFNQDGTMLAIADQGSVSFRDVHNLSTVATLTTFNANDWAVIKPTGEFDSSNLTDISTLGWVMPSRPTTGLPVEIFMRQFYSPGLLRKLMVGEALPSVPPIEKINTIQPIVQIASIKLKSSKQPAAEIVVEARSVRNSAGGAYKESGIFDLRLFRDGQLVGYADSDLLTGSKKESMRRKFIVPLPQNGAKKFTFTAYAFNTEKVKGQTATKELVLDQPVATKKGKAYVIAFGVNQFDDPSWNLQWAAADARSVASDLPPELRGNGQFTQVVTVPLISDHRTVEGELHANKQTLLDVLNCLSGKQPASKKVREFYKKIGLQKAKPEDLVLIAFSTHGATDPVSGEFYLFPCDIGTNQNKGMTSTLLSRAISTNELTRALRDIDAGSMTMIIDACHSAAASGKDARGGPLDNPGLAQLAYYKKMRILAATSATSTAQENDQLGHGFLTFALLNEGLSRDGRADTAPHDGKVSLVELLSFARDEVPRLDALSSAQLSQHIAGKIKDVHVAQQNQSPGKQVPVLFDFAGTDSDIVVLNLHN